MLFKRVNNTSKVLTNGRKGYPPAVNKFLKQNGNEIIRHIRVIRSPIHKVIQGILNKLGGPTPYDKLFHLRLQITTRKNKKFTLEKNEVITVGKFRKGNGDEFLNVKQGFAVTVNDFLLNAEKAMGNKYFIYSAKNSNCQDYLIGLLTSNGVTDTNILGFIKQDTKAIFEGRPLLRKLANSLTDLAGKVIDPIIQGGTISTNPWIIHVKQYASKHNVSYREAMKLARPSYKQ